MIRPATLLLHALLLMSCATTRKASNASLIDVFRQYITGHFDNSEQVTAQMQAGKLQHPFAVHVNHDITDRVSGLPADFRGFFLLEESYYLWPEKPLELKPYLFHFAPGDKPGEIALRVYRIPERFSATASRFDNADFKLRFEELQPSPTFPGATYTWHPSDRTFRTHTTHALGNDMRFSLIETFTADQLSVMELLERGGQRMTPYDSPILYRRRSPGKAH